MKSGVAKHLGVAGIQQQNGSPSSAIGFKKSIDMLGFFGWLASIEQEMLEPLKVKNIGFNESGKYKKTFIGSGVGTGSVQVLQGVEFEVEPQRIIHLREQHLAWELFNYREDSNDADLLDYKKIWMSGQMCMCSATVVGKAGRQPRLLLGAEIWATKGLLNNAKGNVLGMEIFRDQSGNTLRVSQSRFYDRKLVQTLLEGHSILSDDIK
ncbi:hypothetical protein Tco_1471706 [Tanacetum coccineum]